MTARPRQRDRELAGANRRRRTPRFRSLLLHWLRRAMSRPRQATLSPLPAVEPGQVAVSFAGHATALIRYANLTVLCDPMLGMWCRGVKREVLPGLSPGELGDTDLVLIGNRDPDHLHRATLRALPRTATVIVPRRTAQLVSDLGFARVVELEVGQSVEHRRVDVATVEVRHGSRDEPALGYVLRGDGPSVLFCGASGYFSGFADVGRRFRPDIALLPISGYSPSSFRDRHMSPLDAISAFEDLRARVMIPIRFGTFALSYELVHDPERWLAELVADRGLDGHVLTMEPGESRVFVRPSAGTRGPAPDPGEDVDLSGLERPSTDPGLGPLVPASVARGSEHVATLESAPESH